jgi:hypothetical protein
MIFSGTVLDRFDATGRRIGRMIIACEIDNFKRNNNMQKLWQGGKKLSDFLLVAYGFIRG